MDYSKYKILEFRRKYFKFFGAEITINDPQTNALVGYIKMKAWRLKTDISVYTDKSKQQEIVRIGGMQIMSLKPSYSISDGVSGQVLAVLRFRGLRTYFVRGYVDVLDANGNPYGYAQETSSQLAIMRRWAAIIPYIGALIELIFAFVPQTWDIMYSPNGTNPVLAGRIIHRKNPVIVKMSLNTTEAQVAMDPRIGIGVCTILSIRDANKNA